MTVLRRDIRTRKRQEALCMAIARNIRKYRLDRNLSQQELAMKLGTTQPTIARLEQLTYRRYTIATLNRLAQVLNVSVASLVQLKLDKTNEK